MLAKSKSKERGVHCRLSEGPIAPRYFSRVFLGRCPLNFTFPRQVRVLGIGLILLIAVLHAQTATVIGTITNQNDKPAANVLVLIAGKNRYTDVGGRYRIDGVPLGHQTIQVSRGGKVLIKVERDVNRGMTVINLKLP